MGQPHQRALYHVLDASQILLSVDLLGGVFRVERVEDLIRILSFDPLHHEQIPRGFALPNFVNSEASGDVRVFSQPSIHLGLAPASILRSSLTNESNIVSSLEFELINRPKVSRSKFLAHLERLGLPRQALLLLVQGSVECQASERLLGQRFHFFQQLTNVLDLLCLAALLIDILVVLRAGIIEVQTLDEGLDLVDRVLQLGLLAPLYLGGSVRNW